MTPNTIVIKIWDTNLIKDESIKCLSPYTKTVGKYILPPPDNSFFKLRISNLKTSGTSNKTMHVDELSDILAQCFGFDALRLINLDILKSDSLYVRFRGLSKTDLKGNFDIMKNAVETGNYNKLMVSFGVLIESHAVIPENVISEAKHYDLYMHNENGESSFTLAKGNHTDNGFLINREIWNIVQYTNTVQHFTQDLRYVKPANRVNTLFHKEFVDKELKYYYESKKLFKEIRKYKLKELLENEQS